jgi:hypothetical protein
MRKTQLHTWIAMFICVLAALHGGVIHLPF